MPYSFETIACVTLEPHSTLGHPTTPPELVKLANMTIEQLEGPGATPAPKESA